MNDAEGDYLRCLRSGVIAFVKGSAPVLAVEFARRSIPGDLRPSFKELEAACRAELPQAQSQRQAGPKPHEPAESADHRDSQKGCARR